MYLKNFMSSRRTNQIKINETTIKQKSHYLILVYPWGLPQKVNPRDIFIIRVRSEFTVQMSGKWFFNNWYPKITSGEGSLFLLQCSFCSLQLLKSLFENHLNNRWESSIFGKQLLLETVVEFLHEWRLLVRNIVEQRFIQKLLYIYSVLCVSIRAQIYFSHFKFLPNW